MASDLTPIYRGEIIPPSSSNRMTVRQSWEAKRIVATREVVMNHEAFLHGHSIRMDHMSMDHSEYILSHEIRMEMLRQQLAAIKARK